MWKTGGQSNHLLPGITTSLVTFTISIILLCNSLRKRLIVIKVLEPKKWRAGTASALAVYCFSYVGSVHCFIYQLVAKLYSNSQSCLTRIAARVRNIRCALYLTTRSFSISKTSLPPPSKIMFRLQRKSDARKPWQNTWKD